MIVSDLKLEGLKKIQTRQYPDERGHFVENFNRRVFEELGLPVDFVQDNFSWSLPKVIRGLHYQVDPKQGKLVGAVSGRILDVVVDIRKQSETYGQWSSLELSAENGTLIWVPPGFAHGYAVLGDQPAGVLYKVDAYYNPETESGHRWNDPKLGIDWGIKDPVVSPRDQALPYFLA